MALQPKSSNLPDMQEAVVSAAVTGQAAPVLVPGSENAVVGLENCENLKGLEDIKQGVIPAAEAQLEQPKRSNKTPKKDEKDGPILG